MYFNGANTGKIWRRKSLQLTGANSDSIAGHGIDHYREYLGKTLTQSIWTSIQGQDKPSKMFVRHTGTRDGDGGFGLDRLFEDEIRTWKQGAGRDANAVLPCPPRRSHLQLSLVAE